MNSQPNIFVITANLQGDLAVVELFSVILEHSSIVLGLFLVVLLALYTWNWMLRRQVSRHTQALRDSEQKFRSLVEGAPNAIFVQTHNRFRYLNPAACKLLGATDSDQLLGQSVLDRVHATYRDLVRENIQTSCLKKKEVAEHEVVWVRLDGSEVPVEVSAVPTTYEQSAGCLVFARDITARKRTEAQLEESRKTCQDLIENLNEVVFVVSLDGTVEFLSPIIREIVGYEAHELLGVHFTRDIHPEDRKQVEALLAEALATTKNMVHEFRMFDRQKKIHWVRASAHVRLSTGQPVGVQGVLMDITQQKQGEAERDRLLAAIEQSGEAILISDNDGTIEYINQAFETVTGYPKQQVVGSSARMLMSDQQDQAFYQQMVRDVVGGATWQGRVVNQRVDGSLYTADVAVSPVRDADGKITNFVGVARDVTEHIERAAQLESAKRLDSIGRLAGGVAHDFNNLLSVILGFAGMAIDRVDEDNPMYDHLNQIRYAAERAADLTRQLLAFGRKQVLQPIPFDLNTVIGGMEVMLRQVAGENVELVLRLDASHGNVVADPGQIEQVIVNLVANARDAMPSGGTLIVETKIVDIQDEQLAGDLQVDRGHYVQLAIRDSGIGMEKATLARIFEPFFTTKPDGKGTGLGLPTAFGVVKQSGGSIRVCTKKGQGTTFKVYLPCALNPVATEQETRVRETIQGAGQQILVVEDESALRDLLGSMLTIYGYQVTLAANGQQALRLVQEQKLRFDLLLTDVVMPGISGRVLADRLLEGQPGLKVLFMSGYADDAIMHHGVLDSDAPFIQKPFDRDNLLGKIGELLAEQQVVEWQDKTVLMIDDDAAIRELIGWACKKRGHRFVGVEHSDAALRAMASQSVDVLLVDMNLFGEDGEAALRKIRNAGHHIPAIMVTGNAGSVALEKLRPLGAIAVVEKSHDTRPLIERIEQLETFG